MRWDAFTGGTYMSWSPNVCAERSINLYPQIVESAGGKVRVQFKRTPGLTTFTTLPTAPVRGLWAGEQRLFAAGGSKLYEVQSDASFTDLGDIGDDASHTPVQMFPNGNELFIVSAGNAYLHNGVTLSQPRFSEGSGEVNTSGTTVTWVSGDKFDPSMVGKPIFIDFVAYTVASVTSDTVLVLTTSAGTLTSKPYQAMGDVITARTGTFLDTYFIVNPPDTKIFYFSGSNAGGVWDAAEVSQKEGYPDNIAAVFADHEELWLFGTHKSTEVWRNEGDADAAGGFRRDPSGFVQMACVAPWSIAAMAQGLHFLGGNTEGRIVAYRCQGFQPVRISNHAVEEVWNSYETVWDAFAYNYTEHGHQFWVLNFMTANATWVYDVASEMWHERAWWDGAALQRHRGRCHAYTFNKHFLGDWENGKIYTMSQEIFNDDGVPIHSVRQAPHFSNEMKPVFHHRVELDLEITGDKPSVSLEWSEDDGSTWTTPIVRSPNPAGKARGQVVWNRLGSSRDRIYRVTIADTVKVAIADALLEVTPGGISRPEPKQQR